MRGLARGPRASYHQCMASTSLRSQKESALVRSEEVRHMGMWLHLSAFANLLVPVLGAFVPVLFWMLKKDEAPGLQVHARNYLDGAISYWGYSLALAAAGFLLGPLSFVLWPASFLFAIAGLAAPAIAAYKAKQGEAWRYPLALPILKSMAGED